MRGSLSRLAAAAAIVAALLLAAWSSRPPSARAPSAEQVAAGASDTLRAPSAVVAPAFRVRDAAALDAPAVLDQPGQVQIAGGPGAYAYLVDGQPQTIRGMGLNTQYTKLYAPEERATRLEADFSALQAMGVNTVLGWDPAEFDSVLLDTAARHDLGVVLPFDLDPTADYADPAVRASLTAQVQGWVARYKDHPALRMWGLGNEVLFGMVEPDWVGRQDPANANRARAFADWLVDTAAMVHALDPAHPVTYRASEDAYVSWIFAALKQRGVHVPLPWFAIGINCYSDRLVTILQNWPSQPVQLPLWVSEFAPGTQPPELRPDGFRQMWRSIRARPSQVLGGAVYAWTRNGPEDIDQVMGITDDGQPVDPDVISTLSDLFHADAASPAQPGR